MRRIRSTLDGASRSNTATWKVLVASTSLMVLLMSLGSFLESVNSIHKTKSKRLISKRDEMRQQKIRDQRHVPSSASKTASSYSNLDGSHSRNSKSTSDVGGNQHRTRLQPYASMFAAPASDWLRTNDKEAPTVSTMNERPVFLRLYIYETLPPKYTTDITSCILNRSGVLDATRPFSTLSTKMTDIALLRLMETYPGRVDDPTMADIWVVPYPHASHCYCADDGGWEKYCAQVSTTTIDELFEHLTYYNASTASRHLFILSGVEQFTNPRLLQQPLKLFGGNLSPDQVKQRNSGTIVIPYLNDKARFQEIFGTPQSWWTRPRQFAFTFVFGQRSSADTTESNHQRTVRTYFHQDWINRNQTGLGGLPVYIQAFDHVSNAPKDIVWHAFDRYHESIFCPILAGDSCQQARFFDVMYAGCIPVVLDYGDTDLHSKGQPLDPTGDNLWTANLSSWYKSGGETTAAVYPFHERLVPFGIDYDKCVLTVPADEDQDASRIVPAMEAVIVHAPERILELQTSLRDCAIRTAFGMGKNAHLHDDAFAQVIKMIQYHLRSEAF